MGHGIPHIRTRLIFHEKTILNEKETFEIKVWEIPKTAQYPEGITYSMVYLKKFRGEYRRILGFDNREGKGHHKHERDKEEKIVYQTWVELIGRFRRAVEDIREVNK